MASLEEVSRYSLDENQRELLFEQQRICSVSWTTNDGWPVGVTQRHRVEALRQRPKSCVIISGDGTELGPDRTLTLKTLCTVHEDRETLDWFYAAFARALHPANEPAQQVLVEMFDSPRRVVLEFEPVKIISYDGAKLSAAIAKEGITD